LKTSLFALASLWRCGGGVSLIVFLCFLQPTAATDPTAVAPTIDEKARGSDHPASAPSVNIPATQAPSQTSNLTDADTLKEQMLELYKAAKYNEAIPLAIHLVDLREKANDSDPTVLVTSLNYLVLLYLGTGDYEKAQPLCERALRMCEKVFVGDHAITAQTLNMLGQVHYRTGHYAEAEPVFELALCMNERVHGPDDAWTATSLNNLALLLQEIGDYDKAEALFERALTIYEKVAGPDDPTTALAVNNLGLVCYRKEDYLKATSLFERALELYEKKLGPNHPNTALVLSNLALVLQDMGNYEKAEPLCRRAADIYEKTLGPDHPSTALNLNNLALLYYQRTDYPKAKSLFERVVKIYEKALGPESPMTALALSNLALVLQEMGDHAAAKPLWQRADKINERVLGPNHPQTAIAVMSLAILCSREGDYESAESLLERSRRTFQKALGPYHSYTTLSLNNTALLYIEEGLVEKANALAPHVREAEEKRLADILSFSSEQQRLAFQKTTNPYTLAATLGDAEELAQTVLRQKGVVLDSLLEDRLVALASADPKQREIVERLRSGKQRLMQLTLEVPRDLSEQGQKRRATERAKLSTELEQLEGGLARQVAGLGKARRALSVTVAQVRSALPTRAALIELLRYRHYLGKGDDERRYGAVVMSAKSESCWVPLGSAAEIEKKVQLYRKSARGETDEATLDTILTALGERVWAPIEKALPAGTTTVIVSPDAELSFVSFATLLTFDDRFVGEKYSVRYVASGRDLLGETKPVANGKAAMRVFANPAFSLNNALTPIQTKPNQGALRSVEMRDLQSISLQSLPGTARESAELEKRAKKSGWQAKANLGPNATEAELRKVNSPRVLHLATHGFFLPEMDLGPEPNGLSRTEVDIPKRNLTNPMHRSGLAVAGAQTTLNAWAKGEVPPTENDGIVTAEEVGGLKLDRTWLVVLSACDTGGGEAKAGEGVMGLRRGFVQAGTQNLLMTLWPISDETTVQIMLDFYDAALKSGNAAQALADTQRDWLVKLRKGRGLLPAVQLAGPFIMSSQGKP
jgi:CHAT domain-containing protein/tetratricopeptide (TPR) repeat protein